MSTPAHDTAPPTPPAAGAPADTPAPASAGPTSLTSRRPAVPTERLLAELVPPRHFADESFDTYRPDPAHESQARVLARLREVAQQVGARTDRPWWRPGRRTPPPAVYLDGGFGVGKTHLLASLAKEHGEHAAFGTFVEYTNLVGALGFGPTVEALGRRRLVCIDEFELDDPGDTVLMSRLLRELADRDVALAATSNTLPGSLGEGRFAAEDFLREIQALADRFEVLRVDGEDYRHRAVVTDTQPLDDDAVRSAAARVPGASLDAFDALLEHLATVHPSRYGALLDGVTLAGFTAVRPVPGQDVALRLVVLVDRLYDRDVPVLLGGGHAGELFSAEMLAGGYRKKYYRALSRLGALAEVGRTTAGT
ncbi:cell division protein ZapE [Cellulomonas cellasea]|uniref:Cell division protein ZapE n=1 Tax=Cellulomonas cellasea TaxID=43670 RepID=A0A4Y3L122_9CELL|nr:cell division protein ZapE [Cellulomonas cellasea]GEA88668.1 cell division protein ZapE [Cellulomonas cellasea]